MKNTKGAFEVTIPFPAWEGLFKAQRICAILQQHEFLQEISNFAWVPRRITMKSIAAVKGFDDAIAVEFWFTRGSYLNAVLGGRDTGYGTSWYLVSLRIRWKDHLHMLPSVDERMNICLDSGIIETIDMGGDAGKAAIAHLADPIRVTCEEHRAWMDSQNLWLI